MKTYKEFKNAMKDEELQKALAEYMAEKKPEDKEAQLRAIVSFAEEKGFAVTAEQLSIDRVNSRELSDEEIENVVGGEWCWSNYSCFAISQYDNCSQIMEDCRADAYNVNDQCGNNSYLIFKACGKANYNK